MLLTSEPLMDQQWRNSVAKVGSRHETAAGQHRNLRRANTSRNASL